METAQCGLETGEPGRGVVEVRDRLVQAFSRQVGEQGLEGTEGLGGGLGLGGRAHHVVPGRAFDEIVATPAFASLVDMPGFALMRRGEPEGATMGVGRPGGAQFGMSMGADPCHVLHQ